MSEYRTTITYKDVILAETLEGAEAKARELDTDLRGRAHGQGRVDRTRKWRGDWRASGRIVADGAARGSAVSVDTWRVSVTALKVLD